MKNDRFYRPSTGEGRYTAPHEWKMSLQKQQPMWKQLMNPSAGSLSKYAHSSNSSPMDSNAKEVGVRIPKPEGAICADASVRRTGHPIHGVGSGCIP